VSDYTTSSRKFEDFYEQRTTQKKPEDKTNFARNRKNLAVDTLLFAVFGFF